MTTRTKPPEVRSSALAAGRMSLSIDDLIAALTEPGFGHRRIVNPQRAGQAVTDLLNAKADYDRCVIEEHVSPRCAKRGGR